MSKFKKTNFKKGIKSNVEKQDRAESNYSYLNIPKGTPMYKTKEGKVYLDVIPYIVTNKRHIDRQEEEGYAVPGTIWYRSAFKVHRNVGVNNDTVVCPTSFGKPCPICEYRNKRVAEKAEKEEIKLLYPSSRSLYAVIPLNDKEHKEVVHVWDVSDHLFQKKLNAELKENEEYNAFPDLEDGYTLRIRFEEQSIGKNKFNEATRIDFEQRDEAYDDSIIDDVPALDDMLTVLSYKELEAMFHEIEVEDVTDEAVEEVVEEKPLRKKRPVPVEEVDEEEEKPIRKKRPVVEEEEEAEEPVKPVRKRHVVVEEDVEEKPKPKTKPAPPAATTGKGKCPHGHKFGVDTDQKDECNDCKLWDDCIDALESK